MSHTALLPLPAKLAAAGLNAIALPDWDQAQGNYYWTHPDSGLGNYAQLPSGYMIHHTAGSSATPAVGGPGTGKDWSKANAWIGLDRGDGKLYQEGPGDPLIVLVAAGPARVSSGYGFKPAAWDFTFRDLRGPAHATGSDGGTALNRYVFNVETVHRGDGGPIDPGVWGHVAGLGVVLHEMFGWTDRTIGHTGWTKRKIDPRWSVGAPNDGPNAIIDLQDAIADIVIEPPPPGPDPDPPPERIFPTIREGDGFLGGPNPEYRPAVKAAQIMLDHWDFADLRSTDGSCGADGAFGPGTEEAVRDFQRDRSLVVDGIVGDVTWFALNGNLSS